VAALVLVVAHVVAAVAIESTRFVKHTETSIRINRIAHVKLSITSAPTPTLGGHVMTLSLFYCVSAVWRNGLWWAIEWPYTCRVAIDSSAVFSRWDR
jgi:hypothetical protein